MTSFVLTIVISMSISAMCSVLEACLLSLSMTDIAKIADRSRYSADFWRHLKNNIQKPIAVILIVNTVAHTFGASLSGAQFDKLFGHQWIALYSFIFSFVMIQWTEILPKTMGVRFNRRIAYAITMPFRFVMLIFTPVVLLTELINRPFTARRDESKTLDAVHDLTVLARFASLNNIISSDQENIISRTVGLSNKKAKDIMVPVQEMKYLSTDMDLMSALVEAHVHHHTRFPLANGADRNDVIGYVNFKDIVSSLQINPKDPSLRGIARPIISINEFEIFAVLFRKLLMGHQHIAVVRNASGMVVGIITLEDIIEEIVGEIEDEYDVLPNYCFQIAGNRYLSGGGITVRTLNEKLNAHLPEPNLNVHNWLTRRFGRVPRAGEKFTISDITFIAKKISRSKVYEAIVEKNPA